MSRSRLKPRESDGPGLRVGYDERTGWGSGSVSRTPTNMAKAAENNVVRPGLLTVSGQGIEVLWAGWGAIAFVRERRS